MSAFAPTAMTQFVMDRMPMSELESARRAVEHEVAKSLRATIPAGPITRELVRARQLCKLGETHRALDVALDVIDTALQAGNFREVDDALRRLDVEGLDLDLAVTVLMSCKSARDQLPARAEAVHRFSVRARSEVPDRADKIIRWL